MLCFCIMALQFAHEGSQPQGLKEDLFGAVISVLIAVYVFVAAGISAQTARMFNELASMRTLAHQDALTGLYNRRYFDTALHKAIEYVKVAGEQLCLIAIDIDNLKQVNDRHGHAFGDEVIRRVCERITFASRARDVVVRLGGDELMIISQGTGGEAAILFANRVKDLVEDLQIQPLQGGPLQISISIGIANYCKGEAQAALIARADEAMYRSKMGGRNRVHSDQPDVIFPTLNLGVSSPQFGGA